jgi:putative hydrolase of the HAD superfamily
MVQNQKNDFVIMEAIKAVIFDWGGVLIEDPGPPMMRYLADAIGVPLETFVETHRRFVADYRTGRISEATFWERLCAEFGVPVPKKGLWGPAFEAAYQHKPEMFDLARRLANNGLKIALLSNTEMPAVEFFYKQGYDFFDALVFSCNEGTKKPERKIYEITLARLKCKPAQAVLIDDHESCIEGARAVGLNTILFESPSQVRDELNRLGVRTAK